MDEHAEAGTPWEVRFIAWQRSNRTGSAIVFFVVFLAMSMAIGPAAASFLWTALEMFAAFRFRAWLRRRIRSLVAASGEIPARRIVVRLAPVVGAELVRGEIARLVRGGYLDEWGRGVLRPAPSL